jgi:hypothetical protein
MRAFWLLAAAVVQRDGKQTEVTATLKAGA